MRTRGVWIKRNGGLKALCGSFALAQLSESKTQVMVTRCQFWCEGQGAGKTFDSLRIAAFRQQAPAVMKVWRAEVWAEPHCLLAKLLGFLKALGGRKQGGQAKYRFQGVRVQFKGSRRKCSAKSVRPAVCARFAT